MDLYIVKAVFPVLNKKNRFESIEDAFDFIKKIYDDIPKLMEKNYDTLSSFEVECYTQVSLWEYIADRVFVTKVDIETCPCHEKMFPKTKKRKKNDTISETETSSEQDYSSED